MEARLDAVDRATILFQENLTRVPTDTDKQISHLKELHDEKFAAVSQQFRERDVRSDQDKFAASTAINAALSALKEMIGLQNTANAAAIAKSEASTTKELESLNRIIGSSKDALSSDIRNLASRLDRGEATYSGVRTERADAHMTNAGVIGIVGGIVGVISLIALIVFGIDTMGRSQQQIPTIVAPAVVPLNHP